MVLFTANIPCIFVNNTISDSMSVAGGIIGMTLLLMGSKRISAKKLFIKILDSLYTTHKEPIIEVFGKMLKNIFCMVALIFYLGVSVIILLQSCSPATVIDQPKKIHAS